MSPMPIPDYQTLRFEVDGVIARITLARPEQMNLIDLQGHEEIMDALQRLQHMDDLRVVIISGEGACFSAGGDFQYMLDVNASPQMNRLTARHATAVVSCLTNISVPVIAAVQGDAIGFGASLALGCDIIVSQPRAQFADPHVMVGLAAGDGGCLFWPQAAGILRAKRYLLTGDYISGSKAYEFGLVTDLVESPEEVLPLAEKIARKVSGLAPLAVQGTKRSLNKLMQARAAEVVEQAALYEQQTMASSDLVEAVAAIKEKRRPVFKGE